MRSVLDLLAPTDEVGLVGWGQSNRCPQGDRDSEGYVASPHLKLRPAGLDLTILAIVSAVTGNVHGAVGTRSIVTVAETLTANDLVNGELRLVQHDYGESTAIALRRGHAKVLSNGAVASLGTDAGLSINATTNVVTWPNHGRPEGSQVTWSTTGALPGLTAGAVYYLRNVQKHTFQLSLSPPGYGAAVSLAGGSGVHTCTARPFLYVEWLSEFQAPQASVTFTIGAFGVVNQTGHGYSPGSTVSYASNTPPELTPGTKYFVVDAGNANAYFVSATLGGVPIAFSGAGGTTTATPDVMAFVAGYVHLNDRFNSYDNVQVVTPYQPIEPGDYPAGVPVVPGVTLASDVTSYADAALVLPYTWNEGVDGYGAAGTATVASLVVTLQGGQTIEDKLFAGGFIRLGGAKGKIASNNTTTVTVESWTPPAGPGAGTLPFELHLPHHRNNPHHFTAGEGFLYPSGHMQPGGQLASSLGQIYSRPRARLVGSYVGRTLVGAAVCTAINSSALAQLKTNATGQLTASIVSGKLRIQRASTTSDPATQLIQFEAFARAGQIVLLAGMGQTPSIDGAWRVSTMAYTTSGGSYVDLVQLDATTSAVPASVAGTVPAAATVTRFTWAPVYGFGSLIECAWRLAVGIGRRVVVAHLGVQSAGQILAHENNAFGFQGRLGWYDDDLELDWTPSNSNGLAARLRRLVEFIAPRAVKASLGSTKTWKVLGIDGWQGETDATTVAGREMAARSIPTFVSWLRQVIAGASLSPFPADAKVPVQWAQITTSPWEILGLGGDVDGLVNAAITRLATLDGFAASVATDDSAKGSNPIHFNGIGESQNGERAADALLSLIDFAFQFALGPSSIDVANEALTIIGDSPNVTSLAPPNGTTQARLCAQMMPKARAAVLQSHPWSFATRRVAPATITSSASTWLYAYVLPPDLLHPTAVLAPDAADDLQVFASKQQVPSTRPSSLVRLPASQPFRIESEQDGTKVLRTDQQSAVLVYTAKNVDFDVWDPLVRQACAYRLAYLLSGATVKGKSGIAIAQQFLQMSNALLAQAAGVNAEYQQDVRPEPGCSWLP